MFGVIAATVVFNMRQVEDQVVLIGKGFVPLALASKDLARRQDDLRNHAALKGDVIDEQPVSMDDDLVAAFTQLSPRWRQVLWWNVIEGLSPAEISERMNLAAPAVSALLYRAKAALRAAYADQVGEHA